MSIYAADAWAWPHQHVACVLRQFDENRNEPRLNLVGNQSFCVCWFGSFPWFWLAFLWLHLAHGRIYLWEAVNAMRVV